MQQAPSPPASKMSAPTARSAPFRKFCTFPPRRKRSFCLALFPPRLRPSKPKRCAFSRSVRWYPCLSVCLSRPSPFRHYPFENPIFGVFWLHHARHPPPGVATPGTMRDPRSPQVCARPRQRTCALAQLPAAQRRPTVTAVNDHADLHTSKPAWFWTFQRLSSRLTWHDFEISRSPPSAHSCPLVL